MNNYRVSKYNPIFRDINGKYTKDEWTSFSDINKSFDAGILSKNEYLQVEQNYIDFIMSLFTDLKIDIISLKNQEPEIYFKKQTFKTNDSWLKLIIQQIIRENFWAKFVAKDLVIYFGYDLYLHIEAKNDIQEVLNRNAQNYSLFVEN